MIELNELAGTFETLGHESRLAILRLLVPVGVEGLPAGTIGARLGLPPSGLSFHLSRLVEAGLLRRRRAGRRLYYAVAYAELAKIAGFLTDDCCAAAPAGCLPECPGSTAGSGCGTGGGTAGRPARRKKEVQT